VYGLGATLYHALSGRPPVPGSTVFEVLDNLQKPPVPLTSLRPDLPAPLAGLVHRCLRGPVAERYRDCGLVARDLARFLAGDLNTPHAEERRRRTWLGGAAVLLALAAGAVALWPRAPRGTSPPPPTPPPALPPADSSDQTRRAARAAADAGDWVAARAHYDELLRERPADPEALHGLWHALRELGADGAEAAARRAVDAEPRVDAYLFLLAAAQQRGDPPPRIEALLREGLRALPGAPALLEQLGQRLHLAERDAEALPLLAEAAASEPSFRLDMLLGGVLNRLGREQEALPRFAAAVRRQPDSLQACYFLGYTLVRLDRFQEALPELRRAYVLCDGEYPPLIPLLTEALRETGAYEEARVVLDRALGESPEDLQLLLSRALLHDDMGNPEAELADLSAILALDPDHPTALHNRSVVHFSRGEYELALRDAQREVALVPGSVDAWTQVGGSAFALEQNALARDAFARAIELAPERAPLRIGRGQAAQLLGEWDLAIADFTWALARTPREDPSHGSVRFNLAMTYDSAGRRDLALETMRALQRESPQDEKRQDVARYWIEKWTREAAQRE
ncbi:MAG: tetratricopeptide repeat protein, partial [Planctomycetota bacterium]